MKNLNFEIVKIFNGVLLIEIETDKTQVVTYYDSFDLALAQLQKLLNFNFMVAGQTYLDTNEFKNIKILIKND